MCICILSLLYLTLFNIVELNDVKTKIKALNLDEVKLELVFKYGGDGASNFENKKQK